MVKEISLEDRQEQYLRSFRMNFFKKFGREVRVTIEDKIEVRTLQQYFIQDHEQEKLLNHLNQYIPNTHRATNILTKTRKREIVELRMIYNKILREELNYSLQYIADKIGYKNHTTVIYNIETANDLIKTSTRFCCLYQRVVTNLKKMYEGADDIITQEQPNTKSTNIITLYPAGYKSREFSPRSTNRIHDPSKRRMARLRSETIIKIHPSAFRSRETV